MSLRLIAFFACISIVAACGDDDGPAGMDAGPPDAGSDAGPPATPDGGTCGECSGAAERCCPAGLRLECVTVTETGECPVPDLTVLEERAEATARVEWQFFAPEDCAIFEECVSAPGWRRLLRFDTVTPNIGTGDMHLGVPTDDNPSFVYSSCHGHYHFEGYADYRLLSSAGEEIGSGHKQAFCLLDSEQYLTDPDVRRTERYTCDDQGIQRGWADNYDASLPCQWIDVTDVAAGDYTLRITINGDHALTELDYDNNIVEVPVSLPVDAPDPDPTVPCTGPETGPWRNCGFEVSGAPGRTCTPGTTVRVGCGTLCSSGGTCVGDPVLRICDGLEPCGGRDSLAGDDDSCGAYCPVASFTCPASGTFTVLTGAFEPGASYTCDVGVSP